MAASDPRCSGPRHTAGPSPSLTTQRPGFRQRGRGSLGCLLLPLLTASSIHAQTALLVVSYAADLKWTDHVRAGASAVQWREPTNVGFSPSQTEA